MKRQFKLPRKRDFLNREQEKRDSKILKNELSQVLVGTCQVGTGQGQWRRSHFGHWAGVVMLRTARKDQETLEKNKAGYTATLVACGWAGAVIEKVTGAFGQER